jgi:DNA-binding transcriptional regulator YiaG
MSVRRCDMPISETKSKVVEAIRTTKAGKASGGCASAQPFNKSTPLPAPASEIVARVRKSYSVGRNQFARMTGFSERAIGGWERGAKITEPGLRKMREMEHLREALGEIMQPDFIREWLETPAEEFQGAKPIEVIERGETGDIWRFIYYMESGTPL